MQHGRSICAHAACTQHVYSMHACNTHATRYVYIPNLDAYMVRACIVMAWIVTYILMAYTVVAYIVMAYIVMTYSVIVKVFLHPKP